MYAQSWVAICPIRTQFTGNFEPNEDLVSRRPLERIDILLMQCTS